MNLVRYRYPILIVLGAALLFIPFLGQQHLFDWDEINFAECAREMVITGDYGTVSINYEPFWEKPPLFIWMQALSMEAFGINEFAARFPNAIGGIVTLLVLFFIGRRIYDERFALLWVLVYAGSLLPQFYFRLCIIDPWFNLFIFLGIWFFARYVFFIGDKSSAKTWNRDIFYSALFIGLAILTKGPVAALVFGLCFLVLRLRKRAPIMQWNHFMLYVGTILGVGGVWFGVLAAQGNAHIIIEFVLYQLRLFSTEDAGHGGPFYYHWVVLLVGCFPASVFALTAFRGANNDTPFELHIKKSMRILFWVVLLLFSIVKTKIVHYSSLCWFPLTYLGAYTFYKLYTGQITWKRWQTVILLVIGGFFALAFLILPLIDSYKQAVVDTGWIKDPFAAEALLTSKAWGGFEWITGLLLLAGLGATVYYLMKKKSGNEYRALLIVTISILVTTNLATLLITPNVEKYSQAGAISFFEEAASKGYYSEVLGHKSYAPFFYGQRQPGITKNPLYVEWRKQQSPDFLKELGTRSENETRLQREWMLNGVIDKPVYFVCKNTRAEEVRKDHPNLQEVRRAGGFVLFLRMP